MATIPENSGLSRFDSSVKRLFDVLVAAFGLLTTGWLILICVLSVRAATGESGLYRQLRVGRNGRLFNVIKIRTMRDASGTESTVTTADDVRITGIGRVLRRFKLDELPQLYNVLKGEMSLVGPRPDVPGFADELVGDERIILSVRPGITGPATLKYRDEEKILAAQSDPEYFNRNVIFPDKVRINMEYVQNWSFVSDIATIWQTIRGNRDA